MDSQELVKTIISGDQFQNNQKQKEEKLLPIIIQQIYNNMAFSKNLKKFYNTLGKNIGEIQSLNEIPPIPVSMFKKFELKTCPDKDIVRILRSSGTTSSKPSKIFLNKKTSFLQSKALISTLKNYLGGKRRPALVIDTQNVNKHDSNSLTARGAAIRGIAENFGNKITYVMDEDEKGELKINYNKLDQFQKDNEGQAIIVSGFTYIIWSRFVNQLKKDGRKLNFPDIKLVHSGGWKKLKADAVTKEIFSKETAEIFRTEPENIIDFYGMVEQLGVVFLDCEKGYKHIPDFADVIIRDIYSMKENPIGKSGLIEILSILPSSYPGQAIITEDIGELVGIDDCDCGRKGKYFIFRSRVERTETRGCGDTFAENRGIKK